MGKHKKLTSASSEGGRKTTATVGGLPESQPQKPAAKILSSNVQKVRLNFSSRKKGELEKYLKYFLFVHLLFVQLRFMKIAEHDREQRKLKLEQDEQDANIHWCLVGFEAEVKAAAKERSEQLSC